MRCTLTLVLINNFETTIRKSTYRFIQRLANSINSLIMTIESPGLCVLIFGIFGKKLYSLFQQHEF